MFSKQFNVKIFLAIVVAVLVLSLVAIVVVDTVENNITERKQMEFQQEIIPLRVRKSELKKWLDDMESEYILSAPCGANVSIMCIDLDADLYNVIYPIISEKEGVKAIICLAPDELPGQEGKITVEQFNEMLAAGWTYAFFWEGANEEFATAPEEQLDEYLTYAEGELDSLGLPMTDTVLFKRFAYDVKYDATLADRGVKYAVKYELGSKLLLDTEIDGDVLHPGAVGWNESGHGRDFLEAAKIERGVATFVIDFEIDDPGSYLNPQREDYCFYFRRMLDAIAEASDKHAVTCTTFDEAYKNRRGYLAAYAEMEAALGGAKEDIYKEIAEIDAKIEEIRKKYE